MNNTTINSSQNFNWGNKLSQSQVASSIKNREDSREQEFDPQLIEQLHQPVSVFDSNLEQAHQLQNSLKDFGKVVSKFSAFEVLMSLLGTFTTGFDSDWMAYSAEAFAEYLENYLVAADDSGSHKKLDPIIRAPLQLVANILGIKNKEGGTLHNGEVIEAKEQIIGGLNMLTSSAAIFNTAYQVVKNFMWRKDSQEAASNPIIGILTKGLLPTINASLMWSSGAGKRYIANAIQKLAPYDHDKDEVNGAMTSGNQDYLCGINSLLLMVRQGIEKINPTIGQILEPVFALYISLRSLLEGFRAYKGLSEEHENNGNGKYHLSDLEQSSIGQTLYNWACILASKFTVKLPEAEKLISRFVMK